MGYDHVKVINIDSPDNSQRGSIEYIRGDFTDTDRPASSCQVITCLSVIEHGLDRRRALGEFWRLLRAGVSTVYWPEKIPTAETTLYGNRTQKGKIFSEVEIRNFLRLAEKIESNSRQTAGGPDSPREPVVEGNGEEYTFWYCDLQKPTD